MISKREAAKQDFYWFALGREIKEEYGLSEKGQEKL